MLIGSLLVHNGTEEEQKKLGAKVKKQFLKKTPALALLIKGVQEKVEKQGWLKGLDGRRLPSRSKHSALNLLLQSAGAVVMKKATCILWDMLTEAGYKDGTDVLQVLHIHDEYQLYVKEEIAHDVGKLAVEAIRKAGDHFGFRCPLDGEYKIGKNWAQTH